MINRPTFLLLFIVNNAFQPWKKFPGQQYIFKYTHGMSRRKAIAMYWGVFPSLLQHENVKLFDWMRFENEKYYSRIIDSRKLYWPGPKIMNPELRYLTKTKERLEKLKEHAWIMYENGNIFLAVALVLALLFFTQLRESLSWETKKKRKHFQTYIKM